jgi:hypothetical protein
MLIERIGKDKWRISFSNRIAKRNLERIGSCVKFLEDAAIQKQADSFAEQVNGSWWRKNRRRFTGQDI